MKDKISKVIKGLQNIKGDHGDINIVGMVVHSTHIEVKYEDLAKDIKIHRIKVN